jgi:hypothetical protein
MLLLGSSFRRNYETEAVVVADVWSRLLTAESEGFR